MCQNHPSFHTKKWRSIPIFAQHLVKVVSTDCVEAHNPEIQSLCKARTRTILHDFNFLSSLNTMCLVTTGTTDNNLFAAHGAATGKRSFDEINVGPSRKKQRCFSTKLSGCKRSFDAAIPVDSALSVKEQVKEGEGFCLVLAPEKKKRGAFRQVGWTGSARAHWLIECSKKSKANKEQAKKTWEELFIRIDRLSTHQGRKTESTNGCTIIATLAAQKHATKGFVTNQEMEHIIDNVAGPIAKEIRKENNIHGYYGYVSLQEAIDGISTDDTDFAVSFRISLAIGPATLSMMCSISWSVTNPFVACFCATRVAMIVHPFVDSVLRP